MFTVTVHPDDAPSFDVVAKSRDVAAWERLGKGRSIKRLEDNPSMSDMYALTHVACQRAGLFAGSLGDFERQVDLEFEQPDSEDGEDGEADPTQPGR